MYGIRQAVHLTKMIRSLPFYGFLLVAACHAPAHYPAGGYTYPDHLVAKDTNFYSFPIRNKISRSDSFRDALAFMSYRDLDEPNLSIKPMAQEVFRLTYQCALGPSPLIIVLTKDSIIVKQGTLTNEYFRLNEGVQLDSLEQQLVKLLDAYYPLDDTSIHHSLWRRRFLDSMGRRYPKLYDPGYYRSLLDKEFAHTKPLFTYKRKSIKTKKEDFDNFVTLLNSSGYWHLPITMPLVERRMDGWGYTLEANTQVQYNTVSDGSYGDDTSQFTKACQTLLDLAGLEKKITIFHDGTADTTSTKPIVEDVQLREVKEPDQSRKSKKPKKLHPN
jgi:hypothetical protein